LKKPLFILLSNMLALILFTTSSFAAPNEQKAPNEHKPTEAAKEVKQETNEKDLHDADKKTVSTVTYDTYGTVTSVTYATYGGHQGYIGLLKAYENVKDKPAGNVIAALLLKKYGIQTVTSVTYNTYGQDENNAALISIYAADLDNSGEVELAADLQKEAIKLDKKNLALYKQLGKLNSKLDKAGVKAYVNGEELNFDVPPFIKAGRVLGPFRAISEALKAEVVWNDQEKSVTVTKGEIVVKLVIDSDIAYINGVKVTLDVPAEIKNGRTVIPVRFISEAFKTTVEFESESKTVVINDQN
jgi:hypothetical protein